jgi:hypothetical protein
MVIADLEISGGSGSNNMAWQRVPYINSTLRKKTVADVKTRSDTTQTKGVPSSGTIKWKEKVIWNNVKLLVDNLVGKYGVTTLKSIPDCRKSKFRKSQNIWKFTNCTTPFSQLPLAPF